MGKRPTYHASIKLNNIECITDGGAYEAAEAALAQLTLPHSDYLVTVTKPDGTTERFKFYFDPAEYGA